MSRGDGTAMRFVLAYLDEHPWLTVRELSDAFAVDTTSWAGLGAPPDSSMRRAVARLLEQGRVVRQRTLFTDHIYRQHERWTYDLAPTIGGEGIT